MDIEVVQTESSWRPVAVSDVKANRRRTSTAEDALLQTYIDGSLAYVERITKTSILGRTLRLFLPAWPSVCELPAPPLRYAENAEPSSAVTVRYKASGVWTAAPADSYRVMKKDQVWELYRGNAALPTADTASRAVEIQFTVGYRSAEHCKASAPDLVDAIVLLASHRDAMREASVVENRVLQVPRTVPHGFDALVKNHRVVTRMIPFWAS